MLDTWQSNIAFVYSGRRCWRRCFFFFVSFLHSTYIDHGNKLQNLFPATRDPPKVPVTMLPPHPPSSAFRKKGKKR